MSKPPYKTSRSGGFLCKLYPEYFVLTKNEEDVDVFFEEYDPVLQKNLIAKPKTIYWININDYKRQNIRNADTVDQHFLQDNTCNGIIFGKTLDLYGDNIINLPLGHMLFESISKDRNFFKEVSETPFEYYNKCYWRGNKTHITRKTLIDFLYKKKDNRIDAEFWEPKTGSTYRPNEKRPDSWEYDNYFKALSKSDIGLCIRGDRPWLYSFFDIVRAGSIPVCINTQYHNLGWENIGYDINELLLSYDLTKGDKLEDVYNGIDELLKNRDKCLRMKKNLRHFYKTFYLTDRSHNVEHVPKKYIGFSDFIAAKIIEIIEDSFILKDKRLFTNRVFDIKRCTI